MKKTPRIFTPFVSFKDLISVLAARGDKIAFRFPEGKGYGQMTYAEFSAKAHKIAAGIHAAGLADKRVALIGETSPEWVASYLGVTAAGGVIIPMDKELAISEIEGLLAGVEAEAIIFAPLLHKSWRQPWKTTPPCAFLSP